MAEDLNWENAFEYERLVKLNTFFFFFLASSEGTPELTTGLPSPCTVRMGDLSAPASSPWL